MSDPNSCCDDRTSAIPSNLPGFKSLVFRIGTHGSFKARMKEDISRIPALSGLTTRDDDDPSIALIDSWACVLDVLTFYQERIINEGYLPTATERFSILNLARAIGYELKPGVAASTFLAFILDEAPGSPGKARIGTGTKIMSIPGQDEKPQTFETVEEIDARASWNGLRPKQTQPYRLIFGDKVVYLKGVSTGLKPGDGLLIIGKDRIQDPMNENWDFRKVKTVNVDVEGNFTKVTWEKGLGLRRFNRKVLPAKEDVRVYAFRQKAALFGNNAPDWRAMPDKLQDSYISASKSPGQSKRPDNWPDFTISSNFSSESDYSIYLDALYPQITEGSWIVLSHPVYEEVYEVIEIEESSRTNYTLNSKSTRLKLSGENLVEKFNEKLREINVFARSELLELVERPISDPVEKDEIMLDRRITGLSKDKTLIFSGKRIRAAIKAPGMKFIADDPKKSRELKIGDLFYVIDPPSCNDDGDLEWHLMDEKGQKGNVIVKSDKIIMSKFSRTVTIKTDGLRLVSDEGLKITILKMNDVLDITQDPPFVYSNGKQVWRLKYRGVREGYVEVECENIVYSPAQKDDAAVSEAAVIGSVRDDGGCTNLLLKAPLLNVYDRKSTVIYANVARATHGETKKEVLGSGDASKSFQQFTLKGSPLTYVSSPGGTQSSLRLRVNDILWEEERTIFGLHGKKRAYTVWIDDDGTARVQFGDGKTGARLPTGSENIEAVYRVGIGAQGMVKAGQLSLLMTRPPGVQGVTNPLQAGGADDPEKLESARLNAPMKILTLERIVSLRDFEDFARAFPGIGKSSAIMLWDGETRFVHITVADAYGSGIYRSSDLYNNLWNAIGKYKDPVVQFRVDSFIPVMFDLTISLLVDDKYVKEKVYAAAADAVKDAFSFPKRDFGQQVTESELMAVIQAVDGVVAVDLDEKSLEKIPSANTARMENNTLRLAELLTINPEGIDFREMKI